MQKKTIVVSGVSIDSGGPLTIFKDVLSFLSSSEWGSQYEIIAIVHDENLFQIDNVRYISIPKADNWLLRLYYEYFGFNKISKKFNVYLWLSLQVATPSVKAERQALYMHNPSPFFKWRLSDFSCGMRYILFATFFKYIYRINLKKNKYLIVQQSWLRNEFSKMYSFGKERIIVSYPKQQSEEISLEIENRDKQDQVYTFFFPALPRIFKNYEVICEAVKILNQKNIQNFRVMLTIDGSENKYSNRITNKYSRQKNIDFIGLIPHDKMSRYYSICDCLIFPSKLETWGLPISEFSKYKRPMLVVDLPYAHETASGSQLTSFFKPDDAKTLAEKMEKLIYNNYTDLKPILHQQIEEPFLSSWESVFNLLMK